MYLFMGENAESVLLEILSLYFHAEESFLFTVVWSRCSRCMQSMMPLGHLLALGVKVSPGLVTRELCYLLSAHSAPLSKHVLLLLE